VDFNIAAINGCFFIIKATYFSGFCLKIVDLVKIEKYSPIVTFITQTGSINTEVKFAIFIQTINIFDGHTFWAVVGSISWLKD